MRVRLTTDRSGPHGFQSEGEVIDLPREEALRLVAARQAEIEGPEAATVAAPRTAVLDRPRTRK